MKYLHKHRNCYYYKRKIPKTQINFIISLRTDSLNEAKFIISIINSKIFKLFMGYAMEQNEQLDLIDSLARTYVDEAKEEYTKYSRLREEKYSYTNKKGKKLSGSHPKAIDKALKNLMDGLHSPDKDKIFENIVKDIYLKNKCNYAFTVLSEENKERLKDEIIKAEYELLYNDKYENENRLIEPNTYIPREESSKKKSTIPFNLQTDSNKVEIVATTKTEAKNNKKYYSFTAKELVEKFKASKVAEGVKDLNRYNKILDIFLELTNKEYLIDLEVMDLKEFVIDFSDMPNENNKIVKEELKNITNYKEWLKISREKNLAKASNKTIKDKLIRIGAFLNFCVDMEHLDKNRLIYKIIVEDSDRRKDFRLNQLENLFNSTWYKEDLEYNLKEEPHKIWIPLILLFTGARTNEIAQIYVNHIKEKEGIYFFKIKDEQEDQSTKNKSSNREVPIHSTLIDLGFLKYIEYQNKMKKNRLFSELYLTKSKGYGQHFGKIFNEFKSSWLEEETIEKLKNSEILLDLHSFRHSFTTALRKGKVSEEYQSFILGHKKNQTQRYGSLPPKEYFENINKVEYELDFTRLMNEINNFYNN
ncbi:site-specific integrase [Aliarcobacter butzleri]|uniref:site-specific integrase n=1 Tax=Aliarcobacter butzleri TaxID=28197 RepID=UPI002B253F32|nr:site-specific integrase [Aliarcobacter butzleri]